MKRAIRRHHRARIILNRKNFYWWWTSGNGQDEKTPRQLGILVRTPCMCSCIACMNQRHVRGRDHRTRAEKLFELSFIEQLSDFIDPDKED